MKLKPKYFASSLLLTTLLSCGKRHAPQERSTLERGSPSAAAAKADAPAAVVRRDAGRKAPTDCGLAKPFDVPAEDPLPPNNDEISAIRKVIWKKEEEVKKRPPLPPANKNLEKFYVGTHSFGVNRVHQGKRNGRAIVIKSPEDALKLNADLENPPFRISISGDVHPVSRREFILDGVISGIPGLHFQGDENDTFESSARFTFRATKSRRFWRLYDVDGSECVCQDGCGNDFRYIDIGF